MKTLAKTILLCTSLTMALTACSPEEKKDKQVITANQQMNSQDLADSGEQLMQPHTLHLADRVFEMALEKDPGNKKAQFYRAFLKRFMIFEGVLYRVAPYVEKYGDKALFQKNLKQIPNHPLRQFLLKSNGGKAQISTLADMQTLLVEYRDAVQSFRDFVTQNPDMNLDLYLNPMLFSNQINNNLKDSCQIVSQGEDNFKVECDYSDIAKAKINMADLIALKQAAAGEILYLTLYTSYSVGSIDQFLIDNKDGKLTAKESFEKLESIQDVGLLMKNQSMTAVRKLGADFGVGLKWALQYQDSLCPKDKNGKSLGRKGFVVNDMCVTDTANAQNTLATLDKVLAGTMKVTLGENDAKIEKNMNIITLFDRPVRDLRRLAPATWNAEGSTATSLRDKTFGGLFPDGDVNDLFKHSGNN
ncbi:hypothetical protein [Bdellovibrio bacteriovorus]|uniref:hypothetical protein n=1 Tax=Bdellovibrio TaxID=958 RepID=UPI0035A8D4D8